MILGICVGLGVAVAAPLPLLFRIKIKKRDGPKGDAFQRWLAQVESKLPKEMRVSRYLYELGLVVFITGLFLFKNPVPAFFGAALVILVPDQLYFRRWQAHRKMVLEQLSSAVRLFAGEYATCGQIERALAAVGRRIPDPVGRIFRQAHTRLLIGKDPDWVWAEMIRELDTPHGHKFVQLVRLAAKQGPVLAPLFHDLVSQITVAQELAEYNKQELSGDRYVGMLLTVAPLPLYFLLQAWVPESREFFGETVAGRLVITLSFLSAILWFFVDRAVSET